MKKVNVATVDLDTGDILHGVAAISKKKRSPFREGFCMTARYGSKFVARDKQITGVAHRVLRELESHLEFENWILISLTDIGENLGISKAQVSRAMKLLKDKGLVLKGKKVGKVYQYRLNPEFCWRGDPWKQAETIYEIPNSEYMDARRAYFVEDTERERSKKGLQPIDRNKNIIDIQEEIEKRKKAQKLVNELLSSDIDLDNLQVDDFREFLKKSGTR